jgi:hypothetical protein
VIVGLAEVRTMCLLVAGYVRHDPFECDITRLRSEGSDAITARYWMALSDRTFGRGYSGRRYIAADRPDQVPLIVGALRAHDAGIPARHQTFGSVTSILDVVPADQPKKLAVLADLRRMLDDDALAALGQRSRRDHRADPAADGPRPTRGEGRTDRLPHLDPSAPRLDEWNGRSAPSSRPTVIGTPYSVHRIRSTVF